jgi:hypothetical protein
MSEYAQHGPQETPSSNESKAEQKGKLRRRVGALAARLSLRRSPRARTPAPPQSPISISAQETPTEVIAPPESAITPEHHERQSTTLDAFVEQMLDSDRFGDYVKNFNDGSRTLGLLAGEWASASGPELRISVSQGKDGQGDVSLDSRDRIVDYLHNEAGQAVVLDRENPTGSLGGNYLSRKEILANPNTTLADEDALASLGGQLSQEDLVVDPAWFEIRVRKSMPTIGRQGSEGV